jgi:hypothetical protein
VTTSAFEQASIGTVAILIVNLAIAGIAIAAQAVEDKAVALLHDGFALLFAVSLHRHLCARLAVRPY